MNQIHIRNPVDSADPVRHVLMSPCPEGAAVVGLYRGHLLVGAGTTLYWSQPFGYHLFDIGRDLQGFGSRIEGLVCLDAGFYVFEADATWFVSGDKPESWTPRRLDSAPYAVGSAMVLPSDKLPQIEAQVPGMVAVWRTADSVVVGTQTGQLITMSSSLALNQVAKATSTYREQAGIAQVLVAGRETERVSTFATIDRPILSVRRAQRG
jgi:hypothetical protein